MYSFEHLLSMEYDVNGAPLGQPWQFFHCTLTVLEYVYVCSYSAEEVANITSLDEDLLRELLANVLFAIRRLANTKYNL